MTNTWFVASNMHDAPPPTPPAAVDFAPETEQDFRRFARAEFQFLRGQMALIGQALDLLLKAAKVDEFG